MILFIVIKMGPDLLQSPHTQILPERCMMKEFTVFGKVFWKLPSTGSLDSACVLFPILKTN